jgi:hypothetical protein
VQTHIPLLHPTTRHADVQTAMKGATKSICSLSSAAALVFPTSTTRTSQIRGSPWSAFSGDTQPQPHLQEVGDCGALARVAVVELDCVGQHLHGPRFARPAQHRLHLVLVKALKSLQREHLSRGSVPPDAHLSRAAAESRSRAGSATQLVFTDSQRESRASSPQQHAKTRQAGAVFVGLLVSLDEP